MKESNPLRRGRRRLYEQRHWAIGILFGGLLLSVLGSVLDVSNAQSARHALQTDPNTIYRGDFRLYTSEGFTNFSVVDETVLKNLFASLATGARTSRVAPGNFDILLNASLYSRNGTAIEFVCVSNDEAGPWFALVGDVYPLKLKDSRAVLRVLEEVKENQYSSALRRIAVSPTGGKHGAPDSANVE